MIKQKAEEMLNELESYQLKAVLVPAPSKMHNAHFIRIVETQNPVWYQKFCRQYSSNRKDAMRWRKFKTKIKRQATLPALRKIISGTVDSTYGDRLIEFIERDINYKPENPAWMMMFFEH